MDLLSPIQRCSATALRPCEASEICSYMRRQCGRLCHRNDKYTACIYTTISDGQTFHNLNMLNRWLVCLEGALSCLGRCLEVWDL